jgi:general secretion pathway protein G
MLKNIVKKAFTLLELILVIVVLGILAALAVPTFSTVKDKSADSIALKNDQALQREFDAMVSINPTVQAYTSVPGQAQSSIWTINSHT